MQEIETSERNFEKQQKELRKTSSKTTTYNNTSCNEEALKISQKSSSSLTSVSLTALHNYDFFHQ